MQRVSSKRDLTERADVRPGKGEPSTPLVSARRIPSVRSSPRTAEVSRCFGVPLRSDTVTIAQGARIRLQPGRLVLFHGPSGSGKSSALRSVAAQHARACWVQHIEFPEHVALIDAVAPASPFADAAAVLAACGLGDAHLWLRPFHALSDGEKFRARLARAIAAHDSHSLSQDGVAPASCRCNHGLADRAMPLTGMGDGYPADPLLCDEFCSGLHRRAAKAISANLRKLVTRRGIILVLAASHDDFIYDLQPDAIVHFANGGHATVEERPAPVRRPLSVLRRMRIEPGGKRDYDAFAAMHYRATGELGFVDKVFVLRDSAGEPLGIVVYSHPPLELALRNRATAGRFSRDGAALNRGVRILRRLVIHPDLRGCGAGRLLVRKTLPQVGTEYVECLAAMGTVHPVFETAGMERIGLCEQPPSCRRALAELDAIGVDWSSTEFEALVHRQPRVREIVARVVQAWYRATTGGGEARVARQSPTSQARMFRGLITSRPVYYLWRRRHPRSPIPPGTRSRASGKPECHLVASDEPSFRRRSVGGAHGARPQRDPVRCAPRT